MFGSRSVLLSMVALLVLAGAGAEAADNKSPSGGQISYYQQIRPIFQANCQGCHQPAKARGEYVMTSFEHLVRGGESDTAAIVAGDSEASNLVELITSVDGKAEMPKGKPALASSDIDLIIRWIQQGAVDDTPAAAVQRYDAENPPVYTRPPVITSVDFSPDGRLMAVSGFHEVILVSADGSTRVGRLIGMSERIESVEFSPDGRRIAVTGGLPGRMGEIQIWDVAKRELLLSLPTTFDTVYGGSWSPDGRLIAYGAADKSVRAIDAESGEELVFMAAHDDWVRGTVFSKSGEAIFSASRDKTVKMTDVATQRFVGNVTTHTPGILRGGMISIARHPVRNELIVGGADGAPKLFRMDVKAAPAGGGNPNQIREYDALPGRLFAVGFSPDGARVYAGSSLDGAGQVRAFETDSGKAVWQLENLDTGVFTLDTAPDGKTLAVAGADGSVRFIDTETGRETKKFVPVELAKKDVESLADRPGAQPDNAPATSDTVSAQQAGITSSSATPEAVKITRPIDKIQLLSTAKMADGADVDVTRDVKWTVEGGVGNVSSTGLFVPTQDGSGQIVAEGYGNRLEIPVEVSGFGQPYEPNFIRDVNPVLSKAGCNAGTCHGSAKGKNGFKLSLRGYDAVNDVRAFTDDLASRRTNVASPDDSLMLLKLTAAVPHEGGQLFKYGDPNYKIIRDWIASGAQLDISTTKAESIDVYPKNPVIQEIGKTQQIRVVATYADGEQRDVTREAFMESGDTEVALADSDGLMTAVRRGESPILVRYEGSYAATTLTVMGDRSGFAWQIPETWGRIDELVAAKWQRMQIQPAELCTDAEFLRRVYLDMVGLPPTVKQLQDFIDDSRDVRIKRAEIVSKLVGSEDYVEFWTNKWADLLQVNGKFLGRQGAIAFRDWIRAEMAANTPYDEFAHKILTATGSNKDNPAASYYKVLREPAETMENTTHLFLAVRFNCNKCHDHPFERWTQDQYYETAAYFARLGLKKDPASGKNKVGGTAVEGAKPLYEIILDKDKGEVIHDRTKLVAPPKFPFQCDYKAPQGATRRQELAAWITSPDNAYFARSYVNRLWGYLFGVGIIEPIDDIRAGNPATNPELIDYLTEEFVRSDFNVRHIMRLICTSRTYQLSIGTNRWNEDDTINYSHAMARRLPAEVLFDAVHRVTGSISHIPGLPPGTRAAEIPDSGIKLADGFLANMGRPARESACECERSGGLQLPNIIAFVGGKTISNAIADPKNELTKLVSEEPDDTRLFNELFMRILSRPATAAELEFCRAEVARLPKEHNQLVDRLHVVEVEAAKRKEKLQADRDALLAKARAKLASHEAEVRPREAELEREYRENIAKAESQLASFDGQLNERLSAFERRWRSSNSSWDVLDAGSLNATNGAKLEKQKDRSIFASGKNGRGAYEVVAETRMEGITGVRLEVMADSRLPKNGPGRAGDGNFVLSEFELTAAPNSNLEFWDVAKSWTFGDGDVAEADKWSAQEGAEVSLDDAQLTVSGSAVDVETELGPWFSIGPFFNMQAFDTPLGPEGKPVVLSEKFDDEIAWKQRLDLPDGRVHTYSPGDYSATYYYRKITAPVARKMVLHFGSDDGIKVWLNGDEMLANDVARAAAPYQEQVTVMLRPGENDLLVKIHNSGGPSSLYFSTDQIPAINPAVASTVPSAAGSYAMVIVAKSNTASPARVFWATGAADNFTGRRVTAAVPLAGVDKWTTYRFDFVAYEDIAGIRFDPAGATVSIKDIKLYRHELPRTVAFQNAQADYSQESYKIDQAINGVAKDQNDGWASASKLGETRYASFEAKDNVQFKGGAKLTFKLDQQFNTGAHTIGRFRLSVTNQPRPVIYGIPPEIVEIVAVAADKRSEEQKKQLFEFYQPTDNERKELVGALREARTPRPVDPELKRLRDRIVVLDKPVADDPKLLELQRAIELSTKQLDNPRLTVAQDVAWVLLNSPAFVFNR